MSREMAMKWLEENTADDRLRQHVERYLASTAARSVDCSIHLGAGLNTSGQAVLLHVFLDQLLVCPLDRRQAKLLQIAPSMLTCAESGRKSDCSEEAQVVLHQCELPGVGSITRYAYSLLPFN